MKRLSIIFTLLFAVSILAISCQNNAEEVVPESGNEGTETGDEGPEGSGGEGGNESGMLWGINETADEIVNGIHLILSYDTSTESFVGTLENINTTIAPQVRVEVHVFDATNNSTEFGPTTPADMAPGEIRNVTLPITPGSTFVKFNMHPEVGSGSSGG